MPLSIRLLLCECSLHCFCLKDSWSDFRVTESPKEAPQGTAPCKPGRAQGKYSIQVCSKLEPSLKLREHFSLHSQSDLWLSAEAADQDAISANWLLCWCAHLSGNRSAASNAFHLGQWMLTTLYGINEGPIWISNLAGRSCIPLPSNRSHACNFNIAASRLQIDYI